MLRQADTSLSLGKTGITRRAIYTNEAIAALRIRNPAEIEPRYLLWACRNVDFSLGADRAAKGITLNKAKLAQIPIPVRPFDQQRRIAAILDQADALRRKRATSVSLLRRLRASLLRRLVVARTGSWTRAGLSDLVEKGDSINYGVVQPGDEVVGGIPLIRVANVVEDDFSEGNIKRIDPKIESKYTRSRLKGTEILIACVGSIGAIAVATRNLRGYNIARAVARVPVDDKRINPTYLAEYLKADSCQRYFRSEIRVVAQPTLNIKQICETEIELPPRDQQDKFADVVSRTATIEAQLCSHATTLESLFRALSAEAFGGLASNSTPSTNSVHLRLAAG